MVSKYDSLYLINQNEGLTISELTKKLGKDASYCPTLYSHLLGLIADGTILEKSKRYFVCDSKKSKHLFLIIDYFIKNKIDYNILLSPKTVEFIKYGLQNKLERLNINSRTRKKLSSFLSKYGFLIVYSNKPFKAKIVHSSLLILLVNYFYPNLNIVKRNIWEDILENIVDKNLNKLFLEYKKKTKTFVLEDKINFLYQSLSLEGNTLTLPETERLIRQNISPKNKSFKDILDTVNYKKAIDILLQDLTPITLDKVLNFHAVAMQSLNKGCGEIRKQNVKIKGNLLFKTPDWGLVYNLLVNFFKHYKLHFDKKMHASEVVKFASDLHSEFQRIHPFVDGNSRTARAIFVHTLYCKGFPIVEFLPGLVGQYMGLTKLSKERDDKNFYKLMKIIVLESLKKANKKLEYS